MHASIAWPYRRPFRFAAVRLLALAAAIGAIGCSPRPHRSASGAHRPLRVVAAENFWGSIASQIAGPRAEVTSILTNPDADPHLYEPDAANAVAVARADVVIDNGVGYDTFMDHLLGATSGGHRIVVKVQRVLGISSADANPHLWYDIPRIPAVARAIATALVKADPADQAVFEKNLASFDASLEPLDAILGAIRTRHRGVPVAYTERVPGYLLADAGLRVETPVGFATAIEDGNEPSAADAQLMYALIRERRIEVLLYNVQTVSAATQHVLELATRARIPVVGVSETMPPSAGTYQKWQLDQAKALEAALDR